MHLEADAIRQASPSSPSQPVNLAAEILQDGARAALVELEKLNLTSHFFKEMLGIFLSRRS